MKARFVASLLVLLVSTHALAKTNPVPLINQPLVPASVKPGHKGFTLTVNGTGFASGALLYWNGSSRITQRVSSHRLKATINAADVATAGAASVTVVNSAPGGGTSNVVLLPIQKHFSSVALVIDPGFATPGSVVVGDFNNDGKADVAVGQAGSNGQTVEVFLGKGNGAFRTPIETPSTINPYFMATGDFNGDGILDLVASDKGRVAVFLGNGDGTLTQKPSFHGEDDSLPLAVGDWNGDGNLDLLLGGGGPDIGIYLGNGDGTFRLGGVDSEYENPGIAAVGDFNGDGKLDLAVPDSGYVDILLGDGNGFQCCLTYQLPYYAGAVAAADANGDGKLDLITDGVSILLGNGDGTFQVAGSVKVGPTAWLTDVNIGDFNGDGKLDVAIAVCDAQCQSNESLAVLLGNGDGTFQNPIEFAAGAPSNQVTGFGMADFNGDGKLDLVLGNGFLLLQASASLSPSSLNFGDQQVGNTSQPQSATLTNIDSSKLNIKSIAITGSDRRDFTQTNNCGTSLPPGGSCQIQVTFTPKKQGSRAASLRVSYKGGGSPRTVALSGVGASLTVSLTPSKLRFPTRLIKTTSPPKTATLTNTGTGAVTISDISTAGPFSQTNNCPSSLPVRGSCQIQVSFKPTDRGVASGTLSVTDNAQRSPQTVALSGRGTYVKLSTKSVNFGNQQVGTSSSPVPIKLTNEGNAVLNISSITIGGKNSADFDQTNDCGNRVPAGGHCTITVTFTPTVKGQRSAALEISDDGGASPQKVALLGTGT